MEGRNPLWWMLVVFLLGFWGFVLYVIFNVDSLKKAAMKLKSERLSERISSDTYTKPDEKKKERDSLMLPSFEEQVIVNFDDEVL